MEARFKGRANYHFYGDTHLETDLELTASIGPIQQLFQVNVSALLEKDQMLACTQIYAGNRLYVEYNDLMAGTKRLPTACYKLSSNMALIA